jgi:dTMP kinase
MHGLVTAKPLFIVLEGIDGSGTTTQAERLLTYLRNRGRQAHATREPSTGPVGKLIREILLGGHQVAPGEGMTGDTLALLFAADRRDHLQREIEPQLLVGADVISDRYVWSSYAYQAEEAALPWVRELARNLRQPDLTLLIDLPIEEAARRRVLAGRPVERYDADGYLAKVAAHYRLLAQDDPKAIVVDGRPSMDEVTRSIQAAIDSLLSSQGNHQ